MTRSFIAYSIRDFMPRGAEDGLARWLLVRAAVYIIVPLAVGALFILGAWVYSWT